MHISAANPFKKTRRFADFHAEWFDALESTLLPLLRDSLSSSSSSTLTHLPTAVHALHRHLQSYYSALNLAASSSSSPDQLPRLLYPPWRNSLERPFLFLGDLHPYIFTTLLRSLLEKDGDDDSYDEGVGVFPQDDCNRISGRPWQVSTAWKNPSEYTIRGIEQIERGVRLMVPALWDRAKAEQARFADRLTDQWTRVPSRKKKETVATLGKAAAAATQGLAGVFMDANRLRKSVLADIMSATNVYQAALFLEALAQFLVGLRDPGLLEKFQHCPVQIL